MALSNGQYGEIMREYDQRQYTAEREKKERIREIYEALPAVKRLDDDAAFCQKLLDREGVALTPGSAFCCPGYVRLAYTKDLPLLMEAAARMKRFARENYSSSSGVSS